MKATDTPYTLGADITFDGPLLINGPPNQNGDAVECDPATTGKKCIISSSTNKKIVLADGKGFYYDKIYLLIINSL